MLVTDCDSTANEGPIGGQGAQSWASNQVDCSNLSKKTSVRLSTSVKTAPERWSSG